MTVRATSNFTDKYVNEFVLSSGREIGGGDNQGGRGYPVTTYTTYREVDNVFAPGEMWFTPGSKHLPGLYPQAYRLG